VLRWVIVASPIFFVFLAGLVLDTAALLRLFWACLAGYFGTVPRTIASTVLLVGASPALRAAYHYLTAREPAAAPRAQRRAGAERTRKPERAPRISTDTQAAARRARVVARTE
jgi:hypothetical protein